MATVDDDCKDEQEQINAFIEEDIDGIDVSNQMNGSKGLFNYISSKIKSKSKKKEDKNDSKEENNDNYKKKHNPISVDVVGGNIPWNCERCTYLNDATELHCVICYYARFEVKNLPAQWQWKAEDRWITYGLPEINEIENAHKNGMKEVPLTTGWFAKNPNVYKICFVEQNSAHYQINSGTKTRREVRRIGVDDDNLFKKLKLSDLEKENRKCMICLFELSKKDESSGHIVKLKTCKNHGFHLECISQWVQLKGNCPLCRIDVET